MEIDTCLYMIIRNNKKDKLQKKKKKKNPTKERLAPAVASTSPEAFPSFL